MNPVNRLRTIVDQCYDELIKQKLYAWISENVIEVGCSATVDIQSEKFEGLSEYNAKKAFMDIGAKVFSRYADIETTNTGYAKHKTYRVYVLKAQNELEKLK